MKAIATAAEEMSLSLNVAKVFTSKTSSVAAKKCLLPAWLLRCCEY